MIEVEALGYFSVSYYGYLLSGGPEEKNRELTPETSKVSGFDQVFRCRARLFLYIELEL